MNINDELLRIEHDIRIARQIQESFLPKKLPEIAGWDIAARFYPAREVAGDFYDAFLMTNKRRIGLVVADVCDKGVGAALFMALCRSLIRAFAQQHISLSWMDNLTSRLGEESESGMRGRSRNVPSAGTSSLQNAVSMTNDYIVENHGQAGMFATLFFASLDPTTGQMMYVNCGHNPPLIAGGGEVKARLTLTGPVIGLVPNAEFKIATAQIDPGDSLLMFTDGVTEARNPTKEFYGEEKLTEVFAANTFSSQWVLDQIDSSLLNFTKGAEQSDDITMLTVMRMPLPESAP